MASRHEQTDSGRKGQVQVQKASRWKRPMPAQDNSILGQARKAREAGVQKGETRGAADSQAMGD